MSDTPQNTRDGSEVSALEFAALNFVGLLHDSLIGLNKDTKIMEVHGVAFQILAETLNEFYNEPIPKIGQGAGTQGKDGGSGQVQETRSKGGESKSSEGTSEAQPGAKTGDSPKKRRGKKK